MNRCDSLKRVSMRKFAVLFLLTSYLFTAQAVIAAGSWLPTSEIQTSGNGKFTEAFKLMIGKGGNIAMLVILIISLLVFAVAIVNAFWKMRKGEFELTDLGTVVVTGALCTVLVVYALHEVENVIQQGTGINSTASK